MLLYKGQKIILRSSEENYRYPNREVTIDRIFCNGGRLYEEAEYYDVEKFFIKDGSCHEWHIEDIKLPLFKKLKWSDNSDSYSEKGLYSSVASTKLRGYVYGIKNHLVYGKPTDKFYLTITDERYKIEFPDLESAKDYAQRHHEGFILKEFFI